MSQPNRQNKGAPLPSDKVVVIDRLASLQAQRQQLVAAAGPEVLKLLKNNGRLR